MDKADNVFYSLAEQLKQSKTIPLQNICVGEVTSVNPILINYNGLQLDTTDNLIFSKNLTNISTADKVLLLTQDNQIFYVVCALEVR